MSAALGGASPRAGLHAPDASHAAKAPAQSNAATMIKPLDGTIRSSIRRH
jgi:hypothetical protein